MPGRDPEGLRGPPPPGACDETLPLLPLPDQDRRSRPDAEPGQQFLERRRALARGDQGSLHVQLSQGIWDTGIETGLDLAANLRRWRTCRNLYVRRQPGMSNEGARNLLAQKEATRRSKEFWLSLAVAIAALLVATASFLHCRG